MTRGLFVTGTDTSIGKTVLSAAMMHRYRRLAPRLRYWKPIQTGTKQDDDTSMVRELGGCADREIFDKGIRLPVPVSPHLAARLAGVEIDVDSIAQLLAGEDSESTWIVEGAGGLLVPLNDHRLMIDLVAKLGLPIVLVTRSTLGTINHTLLSLEAARHRRLNISGVVIVGEPNRENRVAIEHFGNVAVLAEMPFFAELSAAQLFRWSESQLDPQGLLLEYLR